MHFFLKKPSSKEPQLISLRYRFKRNSPPFVYSTGKNILPKEWDFSNKMPLAIRGRGDLGIIRKHLQRLLNHINLVITKSDNLDIELSKEYLKTEFDKVFKQAKTRAARLYFTEFISAFIKEAPSMINRSTKEKYNFSQIKNYRTALRKFQDFEKYRDKRVYLNEFDQDIYDEFMLYTEDVCEHSVNYRGSLIKRYKKILKVAESEYKYSVHPAYKESAFAKLKEKTEAIALDEQEIQLIFDHDFSNNPKLENCRDYAIIGFWTGMRISDLMKQKVDLTKDYITVTPSKTKKSSGIVVMIPIHDHVRRVISERGTPKPVIDVLFNEYIKDVCKAVGLTEKVKGSLLVYNEQKKVWRKKVGIYEKYLLVSSHTMRRSFATNHVKAGLDILTIMQITGHTTTKSFLDYVKIPPIEYAQRLKDFWKKKNKPKEKTDNELLIFLLKKLAIEKYGEDWKAKILNEATKDL